MRVGSECNSTSSIGVNGQWDKAIINAINNTHHVYSDNRKVDPMTTSRNHIYYRCEMHDTYVSNPAAHGAESETVDLPYSHPA